MAALRGGQLLAALLLASCLAASAAPKNATENLDNEVATIVRALIALPMPMAPLLPASLACSAALLRPVHPAPRRTAPS